MGFLGQWKIAWNKHRTLAVVLMLAAVASLALAFVLERDTSVALFAEPLRPEQVNEVVERLAEWNVPFVTAADNVRVDRKRQSSLLLRLALAGVPHAHVVTSSEVLAKAGPLVPAAVLDAQQRDGLAGDLELGLRGIAGVAEARVIVAPARQAEYADENVHPVTASVRLTLHPGATLDPAAIAGIRAFVAAGVPGLDARNVTLLDDRGVALGNASAPSDEAAELTASLQSALDGAFGNGVTIVRVHVSPDGRAREIHEVRRAPLGNRAIVSSTVDEKYANDRKHYTKTHADEERGSDVHDEHWVIPPGSGERLSVAVLVDATGALDLAKIRSLASATVGLVAERGDVLSVQAVPFIHAPIQRVPAVALTLGYAASVLPLALTIIAILAIVSAGAKPAAQVIERWQNRLTVSRTANAVAGYGPAQVRGALTGEPPHTAAAIISALPAATATAVLELYPPDERAAIVRRMARQTAPVVPDYRTILHRG
jgi:flagellar M-ring protein FliF